MRVLFFHYVLIVSRINSLKCEGVELFILLGWSVFYSTQKSPRADISLLRRSIFLKLKIFLMFSFGKVRLKVGFGF